MPRASFFSNISPNGFITDTSSKEENPSSSSIASSSTEYSSENDAASNNDNVKRNKRVAYTIKIDPAIRQDIREWAIKNDVTISSVIETLARSHLKDLKKEDIYL